MRFSVARACCDAGPFAEIVSSGPFVRGTQARWSWCGGRRLLASRLDEPVGGAACGFWTRRDWNKWKVIASQGPFSFVSFEFSIGDKLEKGVAASHLRPSSMTS